MELQPAIPVGEASVILPYGFEVVSYCCPGLSRVTGFEIWNATWFSPTGDAYIAAIAALCDDGSGTPYVTSFVSPVQNGQSSLDQLCNEQITEYYVDAATLSPPASDEAWGKHTLAGKLKEKGSMKGM